MFKALLLAAAIALPLYAQAADTPPAAGAAPAAAATAGPAKPASPKDAKTSQRVRQKELQATCNARADAHKLTGDARKSYLAKCALGKN